MCDNCERIRHKICNFTPQSEILGLLDGLLSLAFGAWVEERRVDISSLSETLLQFFVGKNVGGLAVFGRAT